MSKKRRKGEPGGKAAAAVVRPTPGDAGAAIAAVFLVLGIAAAGLAVDSGADNSFDSPKRLVALVTIAAAALAAFGFSRWRNPLPAGRRTPDAASAALLLSALVLAALSAFLSPRRELSIDAMRPILLYGLLLPLGASRVAEKGRGPLLAAFVAVVSVNAVISVLQAANRYQPFPLATRGGREATGAFVGNPGYLAFALALAAVACLGILLFGRGAGSKTAAAVGGAVSLAGLLVNRNLTSLSALLAGAAVLLAARLRKRALLPIGGLIVLAIAVALLYRPMRERAAETLAALHSGDWDRVVTYRLGAWAAAVEMTREKPWLGFGPGTYGAEFATHRLRAEIATRRRMVNPLTTSSYAEAHSDYLQPFAEAGIPAGLALVAAAFFLLRGLLKAARRTESPSRAEALCVFALLATGAVAALTWFPFQRPISAIPLLLLAGRGWRISADAESGRGAP